MNKLVSRNPIQRFKEGKKIVIKAKQGISFKEAWNNARQKKQRYFNWTDKEGNTRMYNSKASGKDVDYESFIDNMNEMSALLPTDTQPRHLGWERNNSLSSEVRGNDRLMGNKIGGTENTINELYITGTSRVTPKRKSNNKISNKIQNQIRIGDTLYSRGIAMNFPGYKASTTGLYTRGNKIFRRNLHNGKYVDEEVGIIYKGQQYYKQDLYGKPGQYSTSLDNDNVITYDEYRNRLSSASKNKFFGQDAIFGGNIKIPRELPYTQDMSKKYNVSWFKNYKF